MSVYIEAKKPLPYSEVEITVHSRVEAKKVIQKFGNLSEEQALVCLTDLASVGSEYYFRPDVDEPYEVLQGIQVLARVHEGIVVRIERYMEKTAVVSIAPTEEVAHKYDYTRNIK